ncbi:MAG TPA: hypothetical protein VNO22_16065 [Planctomycetota bacterium]|nr:hypothetical protein [Planctomycetota bacterium]
MTTVPADKATLIRNTAYAAAAHAVGFLVPLLLTPYVVRRVGWEAYGVWVALSALGAWLSRYDAGLWAAVARDVADRRARGDQEGLRRVSVAWIFFDGAAGAAVAGSAVLFGPTLVRAVVPAADPRGAQTLFLLVAVQAALTPPLRHLMQTLHGLQRLDWAQGMSAVMTLLSAVSLVAFLESGWGLTGVAVNGLAFTVLQIGVLAVLALRAGYPLGGGPRLFRPAVLRRLIGFGWKLEADQAIQQALRSDRIFLSAAGLPAAGVAQYQVGAAVADRLVASVAVLSSAVLPAASDWAARGRRDRLVQLLMKGTRYHALAAFGLLGFAALFAEELLVLWLGERLPGAAEVLRIFAWGGFAQAAVCCAQALGPALGRPGLSALSSAAGLAAAGALYILWGQRYDYRGMAWAVSAGLVLIQVVFVLGFRGVMTFSWREFLGNALFKPAALALPLGGVYAVWRLAAPHLPAVDTRAAAAAVLVPAFLAAVAASAGTARLLRLLDADDWSALRFLGRRFTP